VTPLRAQESVATYGAPEVDGMREPVQPMRMLVVDEQPSARALCRTAVIGHRLPGYAAHRMLLFSTALDQELGHSLVCMEVPSRPSSRCWPRETAVLPFFSRICRVADAFGGTMLAH